MVAYRQNYHAAVGQQADFDAFGGRFFERIVDQVLKYTVEQIDRQGNVIVDLAKDMDTRFGAVRLADLINPLVAAHQVKLGLQSRCLELIERVFESMTDLVQVGLQQFLHLG